MSGSARQQVTGGKQPVRIVRIVLTVLFYLAIIPIALYRTSISDLPEYELFTYAPDPLHSGLLVLLMYVSLFSELLTAVGARSAAAGPAATTGAGAGRASAAVATGGGDAASSDAGAPDGSLLRVWLSALGAAVRAVAMGIPLTYLFVAAVALYLRLPFHIGLLVIAIGVTLAIWQALLAVVALAAALARRLPSASRHAKLVVAAIGLAGLTPFAMRLLPALVAGSNPLFAFQSAVQITPWRNYWPLSLMREYLLLAAGTINTATVAAAAAGLASLVAATTLSVWARRALGAAGGA